MTRESGLRRRALKSLQYITGIGILWLVIRTIEWRDLFVTVGLLSPTSLILVLLASLIGMIAQFGTWHALTSQVSNYPPTRIAQADLVIRFVNSLLPSRVSGRSFAPLAIRYYTGTPLTDATAVVMAHTGLYAFCYAIVTVVGLLIAGGRFPGGVIVLLVLSGILYAAAGTTILFAGVAPDPFLHLLEKVRGACRYIPTTGARIDGILDSIAEFTRSTSVSFREHLVEPRTIATFAVGWVGALVVFPAIRFWILLSAFGTGFEPAVLLPIYLVTAYSVTVLPVTPAGLGVTEATATAVFVALGLAQEAVIAAVLLDRIVGVYLPALAGWYPFVRADLRSLTFGKKEDL